MRSLSSSFSRLLSLTVFLAGMLVFQGMAQESVLSASDNATGTGGTVSYSVGLVAFKTVEGMNGTLTEGLQQPYEILFMTGLEDESGISLDCIVYPNPASSEIRLKIDRPEVNRLSCRLCNSSGVVVRDMKIESKETLIPVGELPAGIYILTLLENNQDLSAWKVIKK